jgi:hypothetical protein
MHDHSPRRFTHLFIAGATILSVTGCIGCNHDRVNGFHVGLPTQISTVSVCSGQQVNVKWEVNGKASLGTAKGGPEVNHKAADFVMKDVASSGEQLFTVTESTAYRISAVNANPADDGSFADQYAVVPVGPINKGNTATCDASNRCKTSFTLEATPSMLVRWVGSPLVQVSGHSEPIKICVSHEGSTPVCVDHNGVANVNNASAAGTWTLEADVPTSVMPTPSPGEPPPPPVLKMHFDFGCP